MRSSKAVALGVAVAALSCACATTRPEHGSILPLRTLRLYETGVGYFERSGAMPTTDSAELPVPAGHLDDALKTLVVLGGGGKEGKAAVQGVEFGSSISRGMARALAGLNTNAEEPLGIQQLLVGLKGAGVEITARGTARRGRLIDVVESKEADDGAAPHPTTVSERENAPEAPPHGGLMLLVLTEAGEIVRIAAREVESVRPLDPTYAARLGAALDTLSSRGAQTERVLRVLSHGGPVTLGYVAETPVWRTTYRLVMSDAGATLQGWALLHNDTDEDWSGVRIELANGRPDSFLFPLAAPRYARRTLVTPPDALATTPQLMDTTADAIWGDRIGDAYGAGGLGLVGTGAGGGGSGYGVVRGGTTSVVEGVAFGSSTLLSVGNLAGVANAEGIEAGALFVYTLKNGVDLRAHASILVPFADQRVEALPVSWFDGPASTGRSAVRFVNSTAQTLPAGTLSFFSDGGFAGESALPRLKPGERRYITYGQDLDVDLALKDSEYSDEAKRLVWNARQKHLEEHYLRTSDFTYAIENRGGQAKKLLLTVAVNRNATLTGADEVDVDERGRVLAVFACPARKKTERKVRTVEGLERSSPFGMLTADRLTEIAGSKTLRPEDRLPAQEAAARLREAEDDQQKVVQGKAEVTEVEADLARLREHMKAFAGDRQGGAAQNPFAPRVLAAEDRLSAVRKRVETLQADRKTKLEAAEAALAKLVR